MQRLIQIALVAAGISAPLLPARVMADPNAAQHQCDVQWTKCVQNGSKCANEERCQLRCDQKVVACWNAHATNGGRGLPGKATFPGGTRTGGPTTTTLSATSPPQPGGPHRSGGLNIRK
jgi:hypothetical protein